jgi:hypothetical protein
LIAGLICDAVSDLRKSVQVGMEESGKVRKTDRSRNIHAYFLSGAGELLGQMMQRPINIAQ